MYSKILSNNLSFLRTNLPQCGKSTVRFSKNSLINTQSRSLMFETPWSVQGVGSHLDSRFLMKRNDDSVIKIDFYETDTEYLLDADIPGTKKKDVCVSLVNDDRVLLLEAVKVPPIPTTSESTKYHSAERFHGRQKRHIELPDDADTTFIKATFSDGVLNIVFRILVFKLWGIDICPNNMPVLNDLIENQTGLHFSRKIDTSIMILQKATIARRKQSPRLGHHTAQRITGFIKGCGGKAKCKKIINI
eukprot:gene8489-17495_t